MNIEQKKLELQNNIREITIFLDKKSDLSELDTKTTQVKFTKEVEKLILVIHEEGHTRYGLLLNHKSKVEVLDLIESKLKEQLKEYREILKEL